MTTGIIFNPVKIESQVVILDSKDKCVVNCKGTETFHVEGGTPTWDLTVKSPIKFTVKVFDNLGQFVSQSEGNWTPTPGRPCPRPAIRPRSISRSCPFPRTASNWARAPT